LARLWGRLAAEYGVPIVIVYNKREAVYDDLLGEVDLDILLYGDLVLETDEHTCCHCHIR
jgi:hypothetical protein